MRQCKQCGAAGGPMLGLADSPDEEEPAEWICLRHVGMFSVELRRLRDRHQAVA